MPAELRRLTLRLPQRQIDEIKNAAVDEGTNYSKLVEAVFTSYLEGPGKLKKNGRTPPRMVSSTERTEFAIYLPLPMIIEFKKVAITRHRSISSLALDVFGSVLQRRKKHAALAAHH